MILNCEDMLVVEWKEPCRRVALQGLLVYFRPRFGFCAFVCFFLSRSSLLGRLER